MFYECLRIAIVPCINRLCSTRFLESMDLTTILLVVAVLIAVGFVLKKYVQDLPDAEDDSPYSFRILAEAKKEELEANQKALEEKKVLEQSWRFGIRMFHFMEHLKGLEERPEAWQTLMLLDPYEETSEEFCSAAQLGFESEQGSCKLILYDKHFSPEWLKKIDKGAFFRIVEVYDASGEKVFRVLLRFLMDNGKELSTGTILEIFEPGSWVPPLRALLMESEKERGLDYKQF